MKLKEYRTTDPTFSAVKSSRSVFEIKTKSFSSVYPSQDGIGIRVGLSSVYLGGDPLILSEGGTDTLPSVLPSVSASIKTYCTRRMFSVKDFGRKEGKEGRKRIRRG